MAIKPRDTDAETFLETWALEFPQDSHFPGLAVLGKTQCQMVGPDPSEDDFNAPA